MSCGGVIASLCAVCLIGCHSANSNDSPGADKAVINNAATMLTEMMNHSNQIPDGVLNVTRCLAIFPAVTPNRATEGLLTCRQAHDRWIPPQKIALTFKDQRTSLKGDLLILVIGQNAARRIASGPFTVSPANSGSGLTVHDIVTVTDADLQRELLIYQRVEERVEGLNVSAITRPAIGTKWSNFKPFMDAVTSFFNSITPIGIIIHHSSTLTRTRSLPKDIEEVDKFHSEKGFDILCNGRRYHVAYHYLILPDGRVQAGRPETCEGAHSTGYNSYLGISVVGDFSSRSSRPAHQPLSRPTKQQLGSLAALSRQLMSKYHIPINRILRHSDVARTECPGNRFPFRALLTQLQ
jgi:hypothetical protein